MNNLPQPFWAVLLAFMGCVVTLCVLFHNSPVNISLAVLTIASNLVSGALGAFAGRASADTKTSILPGNGPVSISTPASPSVE